MKIDRYLDEKSLLEVLDVLEYPYPKDNCVQDKDIPEEVVEKKEEENNHK